LNDLSNEYIAKNGFKIVTAISEMNDVIPKKLLMLMMKIPRKK